MSLDGVRVRRSGIHGRGCFATRAFERGALVGRIEGDPVDSDGRHVLWTADDEAIVVTNDLRYLNHAAAPNTEITDSLELRAVEPIEPGDELTIHYGPDWD